jgi:hypothetical protein
MYVLLTTLLRCCVPYDVLMDLSFQNTKSCCALCGFAH